MAVDPDRHLHDLMGFVGISARPTSAGLLQLCYELHKAGVIDDGAIDRIKKATLRELSLSLPQNRSAEHLQEQVRRHLDAMFEHHRDQDKERDNKDRDREKADEPEHEAQPEA